MSSTPLQKKSSKERKWTEDENLLFANIIVNEGNAVPLEMLAIKRSSNEELFCHIKAEFDKQIKALAYKQKYAPLDTSIAKLRKKYSNLKLEHSKITKRIKEGSGRAASMEPKWYHVLNDVFAERCADLNLRSSANDTSYVKERTQNEENGESNESDEEVSDETSVASEKSTRAKKGNLFVKKLYERAKPVRSQIQAIGELTRSIDRNTDNQMKRAESSALAEKQRHDEYLAFKRSEVEKNRAHEIELAKIYAAAMRPPPPAPMFSQEWSHGMTAQRYPTHTTAHTNHMNNHYEPPQKCTRQ